MRTAQTTPAEPRLETAGLHTTLVTLIDHAVLILDAAGTILESSERATRLTGRAEAQLRGMPFRRLLHPEEATRWEEKFRQARMAGRTRDAFRIVRSDGPPFHAECTFAPSGDGQWMMVFRDISDQFTREQELQRRNREAVALFEFARQARLSADTELLLDTIVRNIPWILECHFTGVCLPGSPDGPYAWAALAGTRSQEVPVDGLEELALRLRAERAPVIVAGSGHSPRPGFVGAEALESAVAFPLGLKNSLLGILVTGYRTARAFADEELRFLSSVADTAALVLDNARLYRAAADHAARLKALSSRITEVQEQERTRIARELHDGVGQAMTAIRLNLEILAKESGLTDERSRERIAMIGSLIDETLQEIRSMAFELHPTVLDHVGLPAAARIFAERWARQTGLAVAMECPETFPRRDARVEATLYRILQEAMTNVIRHARATSVRVELGSEQGGVFLEVADDGRGLSRERSALPLLEGLGILNMRERLDELGGALTLRSSPGGGTTVRAFIPVGP